MNILGISDSHEANACLFVDNRLVATAAEERFTRLKMEMGYPRQAIDFCLEYAGVDPDQLDTVVLVSENDLPELYMVNRTSTFSVNDFVREQHQYWKPRLYEDQDIEYLSVFEDKISGNSYDYSSFINTPMDKETRRRRYREIRIETIAKHLGIDRRKIRTVKHERAHAFYGLYASPFRGKTIVLTTEGMGDYSNSTVSLYENGHLVEVNHTRYNHLGHLWKFITLLLGMKPTQHEYKVMGLAPYANSKEVEKAYRIFQNLFTLDGLNVAEKEPPKDHYFWFRDQLEGCRFDGIAGALQKVTEETMVAWIRKCCRELKASHVVISGGVAQNIKACQVVGEMAEVDQIFVGPASGDGSLSVGGCYHILDEYFEQQGLNKADIEPLTNVYLGPEYSEDEINKAIFAADITGKYKIVERPDYDFLVHNLLNDKVIARFSGRLEFGQRALGNRSIIANPHNPRMIRKINSQIKFRDFWMPFTPTILKEYEERYLVNPKRLLSPFMTLAFHTTPAFQEAAPAAIHPADDTARPQILERQQNPKYYDLIKAFERQSGIGALLNTSMNLHGDPMVCSPEDAIHMFENSLVDILAFDHVAIVRE